MTAADQDSRQSRRSPLEKGRDSVVQLAASKSRPRPRPTSGCRFSCSSRDDGFKLPKTGS